MTAPPTSVVEADRILGDLLRDRREAADARNDLLCLLLTEEIDRFLRIRLDLMRQAA